MCVCVVGNFLRIDYQCYFRCLSGPAIHTYVLYTNTLFAFTLQARTSIIDFRDCVRLFLFSFLFSIFLLCSALFPLCLLLCFVAGRIIIALCKCLIIFPKCESLSLHDALLWMDSFVLLFAFFLLLFFAVIWWRSFFGVIAIVFFCRLLCTK